MLFFMLFNFFFWLVPSHQRGHGEANDLDAAVVVPLRLKVPVVARVSPRHGARTVPAGTHHTVTRRQQNRRLNGSNGRTFSLVQISNYT